jgi:hypothetical protein
VTSRWRRPQDGLVEGPTSDTALIETAIDRLRPSGGDSAAWPRVPAPIACISLPTARSLARSSPTSWSNRCSSGAPNAAIVAFGARPSLGGSGSGEAYVQVANYSTASRAVRLVVSRGQTVLSDQRADMAAGEAVSASFP